MYSGTNYFRSRPGRLAKVFQRFSGSFVVITESEWQMYASSQRPGRPSQLPPCDTSGLCLSNRPLIIRKVTSTNSLTYNLICQEEIRNQVLYSTTLSRFQWTPIEVYYEQLSIIKENKYRCRCIKHGREKRSRTERISTILIIFGSSYLTQLAPWDGMSRGDGERGASSPVSQSRLIIPVSQSRLIIHTSDNLLGCRVLR